MTKRTSTSAFGVSKRESHDASGFYNRNLYRTGALELFQGLGRGRKLGAEPPRSIGPRPESEYVDRIFCHTSEDMRHVPDETVALAFTSPPYNAGKEYDLDLDLGAYLDLISRVGAEVYRVLKPGGRYVINIANLGRKPYIPLHAYFYARHVELGFLPAGEIIWRKAKGASGNCAWGSWLSAKAPRLRDIHEYLLVFAKDSFSRFENGTSDIDRDEFMESTLSVWEIPPESAKKVGHPAPFPVELAERVIRLFSFLGDIVLDPFNGSGTTCVAAKQNGRRYIGYDIDPSYCQLAERRLANTVYRPRACRTEPEA